jgi:hypothetical protein
VDAHGKTKGLKQRHVERSAERTKHREEVEPHTTGHYGRWTRLREVPGKWTNTYIQLSEESTSYSPQIGDSQQVSSPVVVTHLKDRKARVNWRR